MKKGLVTLVAVALTAAMLALAGLASAQSTRYVVRLTDGSVVTMAIDVPAGTPLAQIVVPGHPGAQVIGIAESEPEPAPDPPSIDKPAGGGGGNQGGGGKSKPRRGGGKGRDRSQAKGEGKRKGKGKKKRNNGGVPAVPVPPAPGGGLGGGSSDPLDDLRGVPNFTIRNFQVPPFLLPIYQAAGIQYGVRWEVLAAINAIETDYGRNLNVSSAGARGWMQFMPATWKQYGTDANRDGEKDPNNPVDAIFAAARYLKAAGADKDLRKAIFAYNHAWWYVDSVMLRAKLIAGVPSDLISSLTGLTEGRYPVAAKSHYSGQIDKSDARPKVKPGTNASREVQGGNENGISIYARKDAPVVATNDGVIKKIGEDAQRGKYVVLQDVYGNRFTYSNLGDVSQFHPVPKGSVVEKMNRAIALPARDPKPTRPATAGRQVEREPSTARSPKPRSDSALADAGPTATAKERLFAHPSRPRSKEAGGLEQIMEARMNRNSRALYRSYFTRALKFDPDEFKLKRMRRGSRVIAGTLLGGVGKDEGERSHLYFQIQPAGKGAPKVAPKPILDGWRLLEATSIYRANGSNTLHGGRFSVGQVLLLPKSLLERRVLNDKRIKIYECGRRDIRAGIIDRRVLATLAYLSELGLSPTVSSLRCGHGYYTKGGNVSNHSHGGAVDISAINGVSFVGNQKKGSVIEEAVKRVVLLQGTLQPDEIISLFDFGGASFPMGDHHDHLHVGFKPMFGQNKKLGKQVMAVLKPGEWENLIGRLGRIQNPRVLRKPSRFSIPVRRRSGSHAHRGE